MLCSDVLCMLCSDVVSRDDVLCMLCSDVVSRELRSSDRIGQQEKKTGIDGSRG